MIQILCEICAKSVRAQKWPVESEGLAQRSGKEAARHLHKPVGAARGVDIRCPSTAKESKEALRRVRPRSLCLSLPSLPLRTALCAAYLALLGSRQDRRGRRDCQEGSCGALAWGVPRRRWAGQSGVSRSGSPSCCNDRRRQRSGWVWTERSYSV